MRNAGGYAVWTGDDVVERDTFTCSHCQFVTVVAPGADPASCGGFCRLCMKLICGPCADKGECSPFMKRCEQMEEEHLQRRQLSRALGLDDS